MTEPRQQVLSVFDGLDEPTVRRLARMLLEEVSYLDEHNPEGDEQYGVYPCSGHTYHRCSFMGEHSEECKRGEPTPHKQTTSPPCPKPCEEGEPMPWCHVSGHDCPDCALVVELRLLLSGTERRAREPEATQTTKETGSSVV